MTVAPPVRRLIHDVLGRSDILTAEERTGPTPPVFEWVGGQLQMWHRALQRTRRLGWIVMLWWVVSVGMLYFWLYPRPDFWMPWGLITAAVTLWAAMQFIGAEKQVIIRRILFYHTLHACLTAARPADAIDNEQTSRA